MHQKVGSYQVTHILDVFLNVVITFLYFFRYSQFENHSLLSYTPLPSLQQRLHVLMSCFQIEEEKVLKKKTK